MTSEAIARALAVSWLAGNLQVDEVVERWSRTLGRRWRWLRPLARRVLEEFENDLRPRESLVARFIIWDPGFQRAALKHDLQVAEILLATRPVMSPVPAAEAWQLPSIHTAGELAEWLDIDARRLDWFADTRSLESKWHHGRLRHYHYRPVAKQFGQIRLIESPKPRLKQIQRRILAGILDHIPTHPAVHGFRRGRSITTFAQSHIGKRAVVRIDLRDFFPSIAIAQVQALFRTIGYPEAVADLLAGVCTNATPADAWKAVGSGRSDWQLERVQRLYSLPHLPQGAPTSPALANLCAYRLDCRLAGLARSAAASYTRYADDLAFSGQRDFERVAERFHLHVCATAMEEGYSVQHRKTRIMRQGVRQHLAGLVVNDRLNVRRVDFDLLKATLCNCIRYGPGSQNRGAHQDFRAHLEGRLSFVEMVNPTKGRRLRKLFDEIEW